MIEDRTDAIDALSDAEFTAAILNIRKLSARSRAHAARRWIKIKRGANHVDALKMFQAPREARDR